MNNFAGLNEYSERCLYFECGAYVMRSLAFTEWMRIKKIIIRRSELFYTNERG